MMLRLPPSQIDLSPIDIKCHVERIPFHRSTSTLPQSTRELVARAEAYVDKHMSGHDHSMAHHYSCPSSNPRNIATDSISDGSILARDAVPDLPTQHWQCWSEHDRMFWKQVVAHAGSPSNRHHHLNRRLSQLEPAVKWSDLFASASKLRDPNDFVEGSWPEPLVSDEEYKDYVTGDEGDQCDQLQPSEDCVQHQISERHSSAEGRDLSEAGENHHGTIVHTRFHESDQVDLRSRKEDDSDAESKSSNQMDLDGSAEGRLYRRGRRVSLTSDLSALQIGEPVRSSYLPGARVTSETIYRSSDDDETPTSSSSGNSSNDESRVAVPQLAMFPRSPARRTGLTLAGMRGHSTIGGDQLNSSSPQSSLEDEPWARSAPSSTETHRRRSSNLPRSRLHISHAAASSSPDKRGSARTFTNVGPAQEASLIGHGSRDRRMYKPRSESNSFVKSEMVGPVGSSYSEPDEDVMSDGELTELTSSPPEPVYDDDVDVRYSSREQYSLWPQSPPDPFTTADRSHTPQSLGTVTSPSLHPDALPPPFSASARTVSFNLSLPSSSPASQYFSPLSTPLRSFQNLHEEAASASPFNIRSRPSLPSLPYDGSRTAAFYARLAELNSSSEASRSSNPVHQTPDRFHTPIMPHQHPPTSSSVPSPSPPPPRTPRSAMRVYDDRLPAYTQPQNPRYFRRNRQLPPDATYTEPARNRYVTPTNRLRGPGTRTPSARIERRLFGHSDSPVMGSDYLDDDEQENTSVEEELARRLETLRRWRQVAEREREAVREGRLESTPPREERFGGIEGLGV